MRIAYEPVFEASKNSPIASRRGRAVLLSISEVDGKFSRRAKIEHELGASSPERKIRQETASQLSASAKEYKERNFTDQPPPIVTTNTEWYPDFGPHFRRYTFTTAILQQCPIGPFHETHTRRCKEQ